MAKKGGCENGEHDYVKTFEQVGAYGEEFRDYLYCRKCGRRVYS